MIFRIAGLAAAVVLIFSIAGCVDEAAPPTPPVMSGDHEDHDGDGKHAEPQTFAEAYAEVCEHRDEIRDAFAAKDTGAAHGPLHDVGDMLDAASKLADASELSAEAKTAIQSHIKVAFDAFDAVDKKMHNDEDGKDYSEVSAEIDAALKAIAETAGPLAEGGGHDDHDKEGEHKEGEHKEGEHKEGEHKEGEHKEGEHKEGEHKEGEHKEGEHKEGEHKEGEHKEGEHKEGEHKEGEHKEGEHKEGEHKEGEHKEGEHKEGDKDKPAEQKDSAELQADAAAEKPVTDDKQE